MFRAFANQLIQYCVLYLSGGNDNGAEVIKTTEIPEMIEKVQFVCQICDLFIEKYAEKSQEVSNILSEKRIPEAEEKAKCDEIIDQIIESIMNVLKLQNNNHAKQHFEQLKQANKLVDGDEYAEYKSTDERDPDSIKYDNQAVFGKGNERWPQMAMVFKRLESFIERLKDIHKVLQIRNAFENLNPDKFEIGGVQGDKLSI